MKTILKIGVFCLLGIGSVKAQTGANCNSALPFCTGTNYTFPNSTSVPSLGTVSCLGSTPNPIWYYMQVQNPGNINIFMSQTSGGGGGLDVDFAVWGPFPSLAGACGNPFPPGTPVSCSYSSSPTETAVIPNAPAGQFYIMLITNFSNQSGTITFSQTSGNGSTNCGILAGGTSNGPICAGHTLTLSANPVAGATYSWTGPGGFSSNSQVASIPNATAANSGTYTLIVSSPTGADTAFIDGIVNPNLTASLSATPLVCQNQSVAFNASGSSPIPGITTYQWIFNNAGVINQTTTVPTTQFTYPTAGTYNPGVIVTGPGGCKDTTHVTVTVAPLPVAALTIPIQTCADRSVTLDASASSVPSPGVLSEYRWDFNNDGAVEQTSSGPVIQHAFTDGNFVVKLTVVTNASCTASTSKSIVVFENPVADFSYNDVCVGGITEFTNLTTPTSTTTPPTTTTYAWDLGYSGQVTTATNTTIVYPALGNYYVNLVATIGNLCSDTATKTVIIDNDVTAAFSFNEPCGYDAAFTDESIIPYPATGTINAWGWSFGDGGVSTEQNPTHTYLANNINNVTLIVSTVEGCHDTLTQQVPKYAIPVALFSAPNVCLNTHTVYKDSSSVSDGIIQSWNWQFGDGDTSASPLPNHTYDSTGVYQLSLIVTTEHGCSDTAYSSTQVYPNPIAAFGTSPADHTTLLEPEVSFIDSSSGAISWLWTIGNVGSSNEQNPIWTFEVVGTYQISQVVTNEYGCTDEEKQDYVILPAYNFFAPNAFTPQNGDPLNKYWRIYTMGLKEIDLRIYNRWGELLYSTTDPDFRWDGIYNGKQLPLDEYVYKADTRDIEGKQYQYFGTILMLQ